MYIIQKSKEPENYKENSDEHLPANKLQNRRFFMEFKNAFHGNQYVYLF